MPKAQAFDGKKPLSSLKEVTDLCKQGKGCRFIVDAVREYRGGVISVGNAFLNCTDEDVSVQRRVTLWPRITDNIEGEINGRATDTGRVSNSSQVELSGTAEGSQTIRKNFRSYNEEMQKATSSNSTESETRGTLSGSISSESTGSKESDQEYENSAGRTDSRTWDNSVRSDTEVEATAPAGDVLIWGYQEMGHRVKGTLKALGTSKYIKNVVVDEPSILQSSSFVAQTYTAPMGACLDTRPAAGAGPAARSAPLRATKPKKSSAVRSRKK
ncbi:hypothetical protein [Streptomyces sp. NPDC007205]|uniref:hypothetical protein n=1 Tax=Streptomyces sp. NPDC007205 TaxID=3154316 RepID=UPI0033F72A4D